MSVSAIPAHKVAGETFFLPLYFELGDPEFPDNHGTLSLFTFHLPNFASAIFLGACGKVGEYRVPFNFNNISFMSPEHIVNRQSKLWDFDCLSHIPSGLFA